MQQKLIAENYTPKYANSQAAELEEMMHRINKTADSILEREFSPKPTIKDFMLTLASESDSAIRLNTSYTLSIIDENQKQTYLFINDDHSFTEIQNTKLMDTIFDSHLQQMRQRDLKGLVLVFKFQDTSHGLIVDINATESTAIKR